MPQKLTTEIISAAIDGYSAQKIRIDAKIAELRAMLPGPSAETAAAPEAPARKRRKISAAARKRIAQAQKKRWREFHQQQTPEPAAKKIAIKKTAPKRKLSAAAKAKLIANLKKARAAKAAKRAAA